MAIAFLLSYPYGIPKILSSYAFATNDIGSFNPGTILHLKKEGSDG